MTYAQRRETVHAPLGRLGRWIAFAAVGTLSACQGLLAMFDGFRPGYPIGPRS